MTTAEDDMAIARRTYEEVRQNENYDVIDEPVAEDYVLYDPSTSEDAEWPSERDGFREVAGIDPTAEAVTITGIEIDRFEDGTLGGDVAGRRDAPDARAGRGHPGGPDLPGDAGGGPDRGTMHLRAASVTSRIDTLKWPLPDDGVDS